MGSMLMPKKPRVVAMGEVRTEYPGSTAPLLTLEQAQAEMQAYLAKRQAGAAQRNRDEGAKFLAENKTKPTAPKSPAKPKSGLVIRTSVKAGDGGGTEPGMRLNHGIKVLAR